MFNKTNIILFINLLAICLCSTELVKNNGFEKLNKQGHHIIWTGVEIEKKWCDVAISRLNSI